MSVDMVSSFRSRGPSHAPAQRQNITDLMQDGCLLVTKQPSTRTYVPSSRDPLQQVVDWAGPASGDYKTGWELRTRACPCTSNLILHAYIGDFSSIGYDVLFLVLLGVQTDADSLFVVLSFSYGYLHGKLIRIFSRCRFRHSFFCTLVFRSLTIQISIAAWGDGWFLSATSALSLMYLEANHNSTIEGLFKYWILCAFPSTSRGTNWCW